MMKLSPLILAVALGAAAAAEVAEADRAPALGATQDLPVDAAGRRLQDENLPCASQAAGPCGDCVTWTFTNSKNNEVGCDWVAKNTQRRCKKEGLANPNLDNINTSPAYESCPETCGTPCEEPSCENDSCCDSTSWFHQTEGKNCAWAGQGNKWRCKRADSTGAFASEECPESCDNCDQAEANCDGGCCDSYSWYTHVPKKNCNWVAAQTRRCSKADPTGVLAGEACPVACGTCPDPTGQPTAKPTVFPTAPPTGLPTTSFAPTVEPLTMAQKALCFSDETAYGGSNCQTCCAECADYSLDADKFVGWGTSPAPELSHVMTECICLDLEGDDYHYSVEAELQLTKYDDCVRIKGSRNYVNGYDGDDIILAEGDDTRLYGGNGNDHLLIVGDYGLVNGGDGDDYVAADGSGNSIYGGNDYSVPRDGLADVCKDLSGGNTFAQGYASAVPSYCDSCFGPNDVALDCETGNPFPTAKPTGDPTADPTAKPTADPTADPTPQPTVSPTGKPTADPTANPTPSPTPSPTSAPTGLMFVEKDASTTYEACKAICAEEGGRMPCIASLADNDRLETYIQDPTVCTTDPNPWLGVRPPFPDTTDAIEIAANKVGTNWDWRDSGLPMCDALTTDYNQWRSDEPNYNDGVESCAEMEKSDGGWNDIQCGGGNRCCVCDMTFSWEAPTFQKPDDPAGKDADYLTKAECETACTEIGARLPCIGSEGENQALRAFAQGECTDSVVGTNDNFGTWIGLSRVGGVLAWPTECPADLAEYNAWRTQDGEPNDQGGNEDAVEQYLASDRASQWNDYPPSKQLCCICDVTDATPFPTADPTAESTIGPTPV